MGTQEYTKNALPIGTKLKKGQYTIKKVLGAGGFGITYQAEAFIGNIKHKFAIKEFFISSLCERLGTTMSYSSPVKDDVEAGLKSFRAEASRLNRVKIRHANIVSINESFEENGTAYYVMEYIIGGDIRKALSGKAISEEVAKSIIAPILSALSFLHSHKITHLDIKPDNIILSPDEEDSNLMRPVLIDFGLAKHYDSEGKATSKLRFAACSPGYAPNEQYQEGGMVEFTPQADVYAIAATLFFMLTGKDPVVASDMTKDKLIKSLPETVSEDTRNAIICAMKQDRTERTQSIDSFAHDLGINLYNNETPLLHTIDVPNPVISWINDNGKYLLGIVIIIVSAYGMTKFLGKDRPIIDPDKLNHTDSLYQETNSVGLTTVDTLQSTQSDHTTISSNELPQHSDTPSQSYTPTKPPKQNDNVSLTGSSTSHDELTTSIIYLDNAVWEGKVKNRKPNGKGKMTYTASANVHGLNVEAGYYIVGDYENGKLVSGIVYDENGNKIKTLIP